MGKITHDETFVIVATIVISWVTDTLPAILFILCMIFLKMKEN